MTGTVAHVAAAVLVLLLGHFGISSTPLRDALVRRLGLQPYRGLFSLIAGLSFWWLGAAYSNAPYEPLWLPAPWQSWVPLLVMPAAVFLLVNGLSTSNPTSVGQDALLRTTREPARGILRVTRNPVMWGTGLWALSHLIPNGDVASVILFGGLALLALAGSVLIDAKLARRLVGDWEGYAMRTSNIPFAAILAGRQRFVWAEIGWGRAVAALAVYAAFLMLHRWVIGVSALPS